MLRKFQRWLRDSLDTRERDTEPQTTIEHACCLLLIEVARLEPTRAEQKLERVAEAMRAEFAVPEIELAAMIDTFTRPESRLTSYFEPARLVNSHLSAARKAHFVEQLWRVAMVDGAIDMYEDHLVRKLSDLLYVPHREFILAKNRVQATLTAES